MTMKGKEETTRKNSNVRKQTETTRNNMHHILYKLFYVSYVSYVWEKISTEISKTTDRRPTTTDRSLKTKDKRPKPNARIPKTNNQRPKTKDQIINYLELSRELHGEDWESPQDDHDLHPKMIMTLAIAYLLGTTAHGSQWSRGPSHYQDLLSNLVAQNQVISVAMMA